MAVLIATPKRWAAWFRDCPSCFTAATTRSRRSIEYGLAIRAASIPAPMLNQTFEPLGRKLPI
jgi:hypothetical protein